MAKKNKSIETIKPTKKPGRPKKVPDPPLPRLDLIKKVLNNACRCDEKGDLTFYSAYYNRGRYTEYTTRSWSGDLPKVSLCSMITDATKSSEDIIWNYCIDRIFRVYRLYCISSWKEEQHNGYYDEIYYEYTLLRDKANKILEVLTEIDSLNDCDKIKKCLELEYGYLLPMLENKTMVSVIDNVKKDSLYLSENYLKKINKEDIEIYSGYKMPCAVCIRRHVTPIGPFGVIDGYSVIDGYHRVLAAQNNKAKSVSILLLE